MSKPRLLLLFFLLSAESLGDQFVLPSAACKAQSSDTALIWTESGILNNGKENIEVLCPITIASQKSEDDKNFFKATAYLQQGTESANFNCALYKENIAYHEEVFYLESGGVGTLVFYLPLDDKRLWQSISLGCSLPPAAAIKSLVINKLAGVSVGGTVSGMNELRGMEVQLGDQSLHISRNGDFVFKRPLLSGEQTELEVSRNPVHQDCEISGDDGGVLSTLSPKVSLICEDKKSTDLYSLDKIHYLRLTITKAEWEALLLDTLRSNYSIRTATGRAWEGNSWTHSEVYRQADFEYLDEEGNVLGSEEKVAFKMIGNTSRQIPIDVRDSDAGTGPIKPMRFSFSIKFDEEFEDDESVYGCIDEAGNLARVDNNACNNLLAQEIPEFKDADGREFKEIEKIRLRYNRDDPSYQREVLAHEILYKSGVPVARATHAAVEFMIVGEEGETLYGQSLPRIYNMGVFVMVEMIDKPFLKSYFDKNGYLFKVGAPGNLSGAAVSDTDCIPYEDSDEFFNENFCVIGIEKPDPMSREEWLGVENSMDPEFVNTLINWEGENGNQSQFLPYKPTYDLKTKKKSIKKARVALAEFATFVKSNPSLVELGERFDIPGFVKAQAAEIVLGAVDHYVRVANNYYLYFNEPSGKWIYMPTDFDYTLIDTPSPDCSVFPKPAGCHTGFLDFKTFQDIGSTTAFPFTGMPDWASRPFYPNGPPILWNQIFASTENKLLLYREISEILKSHFNWDEGLKDTLLQRRDRISPFILSTDAGIPGDGCAQIYNPEEIDGDSSSFCDPNRLSIGDFVKLRVETLEREISAATE